MGYMNPQRLRMEIYNLISNYFNIKLFTDEIRVSKY